MKYKLSYSIGFIALSLFFLVSIPSASADTKPSVTTQAVTSIGTTAATGNGNVTYSGGFTITTRGIEWGTSSGIYPNSVTQNGSFGTGAFTASLINLPAGTTIYARAKAYNPLGWGYGSQISFITKSATPTGTLTPTSSSCTIVSGASSCTQTLTWTTTNPIGTSAVTSPTGTPSPVNGNSGSRSFTVPYNAAGVNFFLYNNAILLAQTKINTFCASNTTWNGSRCATNTYTVTPSAGTGGSLSPSTAQTVAYNGIKSFTVTANSGYTISSVTGCSGSLSGTTYTTGAITGACTVTAAFAAIPPPTPTATLSATSPIVSGSHSTITWTSANATSCSISPTVSLGEGGPLNGNGSTAVLTTTTTTTYTYTLTCTGAGGTTKTATATVTVTPPAPDLTASFVTPTTAIVGTAVTLSSTITNSGTASTGGGFTNLFQIADDSSGTNATVIGTSAQSSSLAANSTATASLSYAFTSYGTWYVSVCADKSSISSSGVITESNENNNCGAWTAITVAKADPDISIFTASPPNVAYGGRSVLTWKATNVSSCSAYGAWSNQGTFSGSGLTNPLTAYAIFTFQCYGFAQKGSDNKPMVTKGADVSVSAAPSSCATSGTCHTFSKTVCACADVISRGDLAFVFGKVDHTTCGGTSFSGYTYVCGTFTYNLGLNKTMYLAQGNNINDPIVVNGEFASSQSFYCNEPASCAWRSCSFSDWSCVANSGTKYDSDLKAVNDLQGSSDSIDSIYLYESLREVRSTVYPDVFLRTVDIKEVSQDSYTDYSSPPTYTVHLVRDILDQWITYPGSSSAESSISFFGDFLPVASDAYNGAEISGRSGSMIGAFTPNYGSFKIAEIKYFVTQMQDGFCSATHYSCASGGVSYNHAESSTAWTWSCSAPGGGDPSSCSEGKPDLIAGFVSPTSATTTATVLSATISNIGTGSTRAGFTNLFQKATNANGAGATDIGTSASTELAANGTSVASLSYTFPSFGTYYIRVCADKSSAGNAGVITESNENNNCGGWTTVTVSNSVTLTATPTSVAPGGHATLTWTSSNVINCSITPAITIGEGNSKNGNGSTGALNSTTTFTFLCVGLRGTSSATATVTVGSGPDLTAGDISPTSAAIGTATTFNSTVSNIGSASTGTSFNNFMQVATAVNGGGTITDISPSVSMSALAAGGNSVFSKSYTFSSAGTYSLRVCADKSSAGNAGVITESNENNNCSAWTTVIVSSNINATCSVSPASGYIGNSFTWTVTNATGGTSPYTYTWSGTDGLSGTGQTVTKAYATVGTKTGSVTVTGSSGGSRTIDCTNSVAVTPCYGQGCSCQGCDGGGGCDYPPPPAQPNTITPSKCCSPTSGVCPVPPTVTLAADPTETYEGKTSELSWESSSDSGVDYCTWTGSYFTPAKTTTHGRKNDGTSTTTRPLLIDMNFGITCTGTNGLTSDVVTVPITVHGPDLSITADPERVPAGSASTIKWSANYVKYCTVTNSSDPGHTLAQGSTNNGKFEDGLEKVTINGQSIFTINCDSFNEAKPKEIKSVIVNILPLFQEF